MSLRIWFSGTDLENKAMNTSLPPTIIPPDWTDAKDRAFVEQSGGDNDLDTLFAEVLHARRHLGDTLNTVLAGFGASIDCRLTIEKLFMVENIVRADSLSDNHLAWVLEAVFYARYAIEQFERIIGLYSHDSKLSWLMPLIELRLHLETATELLEERDHSRLAED